MASDIIDSFQGEYRWLSNFEPVDIVFEGELYPSVEHAYVAAKTLDRETRKGIAKLSSPGAAKRAGRSLQIRADWDAVKLDIMRSLTRQKYLHAALRRKLLATGDAEIVEGNAWNDTFWGVCNGVGENHLGKIIMEVRSEWMAQ